MKLILALGNPGPRYAQTRHNAGFMVLDTFSTQQDTPFQPRNKFSSNIAETNIYNEKVLIVKPTTFYNDSGVAARSLLDFYKIQLEDILVIHDDTDLDFGKIRVRQGGRDAGNNGLKSLHQHIGQDFWHIRIGTDSLLRRHIGDTDFVLSRFNSDEQTIFQDWITPTAIAIIDQFLSDTIAATSYKK